LSDKAIWTENITIGIEKIITRMHENRVIIMFMSSVNLIFVNSFLPFNCYASIYCYRVSSKNCTHMTYEQDTGLSIISPLVVTNLKVQVLKLTLHVPKLPMLAPI
jgi:hypothetical protein